MEIELIGSEVEGSAFVYGSSGSVERVSRAAMMYTLESYKSKPIYSMNHLKNKCICSFVLLEMIVTP